MRADLAVGVAGVVDHLVFVARGAGSGFSDEVFHPVVAGFGEFPFPGKLEVVVFFLGDEFHALDLGDGVERAVDDLPATGGLFVVGAPAIEGLAVEEERPAGLFFGGGEFVFGGVRGERTSGEGEAGGEGAEVHGN